MYGIRGVPVGVALSRGPCVDPIGKRFNVTILGDGKLSIVDDVDDDELSFEVDFKLDDSLFLSSSFFCCSFLLEVDEPSDGSSFSILWISTDDEDDFVVEDDDDDEGESLCLLSFLLSTLVLTVFLRLFERVSGICIGDGTNFGDLESVVALSLSMEEDDEADDVVLDFVDPEFSDDEDDDDADDIKVLELDIVVASFFTCLFYIYIFRYMYELFLSFSVFLSQSFFNA